TMIVVPELRGDEHFLPLDLPRLEHLLHRFADLFFISVAFRSVELAKSCLQRRLGRGSGCNGVGNQCAKSEGGDSTGSIVEGHPRIAKVVAPYHCLTPSSGWFSDPPHSCPRSAHRWPRLLVPPRQCVPGPR